MKIKKVAGILLAGTMMISMAACGGKEEGAKSEKLIVGTEAGFAPYEYMKGNEVVGIDMDIAKAIADEMGKELEIKNMDFDGALAAVQILWQQEYLSVRNVRKQWISLMNM